MSPSERKEIRKRRRKYRRARIRHFLFTHGPDRLTRGRTTRRHLSTDMEVREVEVESARWPRGFDGLRIAHVSDFHLGKLLPIEAALEVVDLVADLEPDLVACTGDVVDLHHAGCEPLLEAMAEIDAPIGSYLVLGNHDELEDGEAVARKASEAGLTVLRDDAVKVAHRGDHLVIAGVEWGKTLAQCRRHVNAACDESVHVLLSHNPKSFRRAAEMGIPLTLAGHTHGGQIALKNRPNANLSFTHRHSSGIFEKNESHLYVTTGVGAWFPLRVNCPPEVVLLTVRSPAANGGRDE